MNYFTSNIAKRNTEFSVSYFYHYASFEIKIELLS